MSDYKHGTPMKTRYEIYSTQLLSGFLSHDVRVSIPAFEEGEFTANDTFKEKGFDGTFYCLHGTFWVKLEWLKEIAE